MRAIGILVLALMAPGVLAAQGRGPDQDRRVELERQVRHRFLATVAERLELTDSQREKVREVLAEGAQARRELALESHALRMELMQAVRDDAAPMARFESILERLEAVRARERQLEQVEEAELAEVLNPRQRALFLMMRMQFNDRIRQMRGMRGDGPGHDMPGGPDRPGGPGGERLPFV